MTQKEKIIKTYRDQEVTEVFDSERKSFKYQRYKHLIEANFLKKIPEPKWYQKKLPQTTHFDRTEWVDKEVGDLYLKDGVKLI